MLGGSLVSLFRQRCYRKPSRPATIIPLFVTDRGDNYCHPCVRSGE